MFCILGKKNIRQFRNKSKWDYLARNSFLFDFWTHLQKEATFQREMFFSLLLLHEHRTYI